MKIHWRDMSDIQRDDMKCGYCKFCIKDDGHPYCVMKDLYTNVELNDICDEINACGRYYFAIDKVKKEQQ